MDANGWLWRVYTLLRREGWQVNHKRVYRLYREEGLNLRSKRPRRSRAAAHRLPRVEVGCPHESWSMDFVADATFHGRRFRALTVVDNSTRRCLAIHADQSIKGAERRGRRAADQRMRRPHARPHPGQQRERVH